MIEYVACTEKGSGRKKNEDRVLIDKEVISYGNVNGRKDETFISVVCDGVGGSQGGEKAADIVASGFKDLSISSVSPITLNNHIKSLNQSILNEQKLNPDYKYMSTAATGIIFYKNQYILFNLGDSRIYEVKDGEIKQKTKDHTLENNDKLKNIQPWKQDILTKFLGGPCNYCNPDIMRGQISEKERLFLICSDGIYKKIKQEELNKILSEPGSLEEKKQALLQCATQNGSTDDKSIVLIRYSR